MQLRYDPFRDVERLAEGLLGSTGRMMRTMPMDVFRAGDHFVLTLDLPGIDPGTVDLSVEDNVLTVRAERTPRSQDVQYLVAERPTGSFTRRIVLGDGMDLARIQATYDDGVLTVDIPVAEQAKPRRIDVNRRTDQHKVIEGHVSSAQDSGAAERSDEASAAV